tara:strand:+ start:3088 stop:3771 length:684 start_codon:yes stop_codon:yes gene_type:complete
MQEKIKDNLIKINNKISKAKSGNNSSKEVLLIAVSKKKSIEHINTAFNEGIRNFGENYAQELEDKFLRFENYDITWHFIGPIQSNKIKLITKCSSWVHGLYREKVILKLNEECKKINKTMNGLIQINVSQEISKNGCSPDEMFKVAEIFEKCTNVKLKGIMALPKLSSDLQESKKVMQGVYELSQILQSKYPTAKEISLGTTADFDLAIESGSTMIRIGESIFGIRK